eukprot:gene5371-5394_t
MPAECPRPGDPRSATPLYTDTPFVRMLYRVALVLMCTLRCQSRYRVTVDLNTYTAPELAYAATAWGSGPTSLDGTWSLVNNSAWNGSATTPSDADWRAALAAIGPEHFSEEMWPCDAADDAAWNCSAVTPRPDHSAGQCRIVGQLAPAGVSLAAAFAYHETGTLPHTMLSAAEIAAVSEACGGCGVLGHTRLYKGPWKQMVDLVLGHPQLLGVAIEIDITAYSPGHPVFGSAGPFVKALLTAGKQPFFLLPFKADGRGVTGMPAAEQMQAFLSNVSVELGNSALMLNDPRVNFVLARYSHNGFLPVQGDNDDTISAAVSKALQM